MSFDSPENKISHGALEALEIKWSSTGLPVEAVDIVSNALYEIEAVKRDGERKYTVRDLETFEDYVNGQKPNVRDAIFANPNLDTDQVKVLNTLITEFNDEQKSLAHDKKWDELTQKIVLITLNIRGVGEL
jgi:hypothetical protein